MKIISHRGNLFGPNPKYENTIAYIEHALHHGFMCEVDVHVHDPIARTYSLGHEKFYYPREVVSERWFREREEDLLIHCKDEQTFNSYLGNIIGLNCFFQKDEMEVKTTGGYRLFHENNDKKWDENTILVKIKDVDFYKNEIRYKVHPKILPFGIVTDNPEKFRGDL